MIDTEIITRLDRIIELLEAIQAQCQRQVDKSVILQERGLPSHHNFAQKPTEAFSPDYKQQFANGNKT